MLSEAELRTLFHRHHENRNTVNAPLRKESFRFGEWLVDPLTNSIEQAGVRRQMEPRAMDVLLVLCDARGKIVNADELMRQCWGSAVYGDNPVHKTLTQLRRLLGDTASSPKYIETIRKRGYRTLAIVSFDRVAGAPVQPWRDGSPFRGLLAFDEDHAQVFFGRDESIRQLVSKVRNQIAGGLALQLVLGSSGSGKTSLVRAGIFPALSPARNTSGCAFLAATTFDMAELDQQNLFTALASALLDLEWDGETVFSGDSALSLGQRLEYGSDAVVRELKVRLATVAAGERMLRFCLFIDRFEALFDVGRVKQSECQAFVDLIEKLARSDVVMVLIACRNDFYPHLAQHAVLMEGKLNGAHFDLIPPTFTDIAQIIRLPATAAGLSFEIDAHSNARLDDVLCADAAASPDALPLLQYCLQELYCLRTDAGELSFAALEQVGGVEGALAQRAEQVAGQFSEAQNASLAHVMSLVIVLSSNEETVTSKCAPWSALRSEAERQVVSALIESRLMVSDLTGGVPTFGLAHEAILRRWPRMREWIEMHREALLVRDRLAQMAARWAREGRSNDLLLPRGKQLEAAQSLQEANHFVLSDDEVHLIRLSARRVRIRDRLRLLALSTIVALAILATSLGVTAIGAKRMAEQRRVEAEGLMGYMLGDFADRLRPLGRLDLLDSVSTKALEYLGGTYDKGSSKAALIQRAKALQVIGEVRRSRGDSKAAMDAFNSANAILMRQIAVASNDTEVLKNLGVNAYWLGQLSRDQNDWEQAGKFWHQYQAFADQLNKLEPNEVEWWVEQSYAHNNLGSLAAARDDASTAAREFLMSIELKRRALDRKPEATMVAAELADSYSWLASADQALGALADTGKLYAQEMDIVLRLRQVAPRDALWIKREARALEHRAINHVALGQNREALDDYRRARVLFTQIVEQDAKNYTWQSEVAYLEQEELHLIARTHHDDSILSRMREIHSRFATLLLMNPKNVDWARREATARLRIAEFLFEKHQFGEADQQAQLALQQLNALHAGNRANKSISLTTVDALLLSARVSEALGEARASKVFCGAAFDMIKNKASTLDYQFLDPLVRASNCLGNTEVAVDAAERLRKIGYRDVEFLRYLSNPTRRNQL